MTSQQHPRARTGFTGTLRLHTPIAVLLVVVVVMLFCTGPAAVHGGIISLLQNNVLGSSEFHKQQSWPFDAGAGQRRAPEFIALHGDKSERLIERIGLGMDGRMAERREQQMIRDFLYDQQQRQLDQQQQLFQQQNALGGYVRPDYDPAPRLQVLSATASGFKKR